MMSNVCSLCFVCCVLPQGLFRVAASGAKVKKLKAAFDAGLASLDDYQHDVHCIAGMTLLF